MTIPSRMTDTSMQNRMLADLQRSKQRGQTVQQQISSGKQISRPSDSPTGTVTSLQLRGEVRSTQQYSRNADDGMGWLGVIQDKLQDASTSVIRVRNLTVEALNSATGTDDAREALAFEIDNIKQTLIGQANSKYLNRPVFGGTTAGGEAYSQSGKYAGDSNGTTRSVGPNAKVRIETTGPEAFGAEGSDTQLFTVLTNISRAIRDNDTTALDNGLNNLDEAHSLLKST